MTTASNNGVHTPNNTSTVGSSVPSATNSIQGSVQEYLESQPAVMFERLYSQPATCLAILRLLPPVAKHIVVRLLYFHEPIHRPVLESWCAVDHINVLNHAIKKLERLHIFLPVNYGTEWRLNRVFQVNLHNAFVGGGNHTSFGQFPETEDRRHNVDRQFLDLYASEAWEAVLHSLVTPTHPRPPAVTELLKHSGLMTAEETGGNNGQVGNLKITSKGFQFLLQDVNIQVWAFLLQYLEMAPNLEMKPDEVLNFLFQLGSLELGQDYSVETLTPTQTQMLADLKHLGIIYQRRKSKRFYPTRLATSLTSGSMVSTNFSDEVGFIILETNYRLYAYTDSPLQIAVLSLFVSLKARFANMVVGVITRDSIRDALIKGISASQIIQYLGVHAHPEMKKKTPVLPATVVDQINLWELERNRLRATNSYIYKEFSVHEDYLKLLKYAKDLGFHLWNSDSPRMILIVAEGHPQMREFIKQMLQEKKKNAQR